MADVEGTYITCSKQFSYYKIINLVIFANTFNRHGNWYRSWKHRTCKTRKHANRRSLASSDQLFSECKPQVKWSLHNALNGVCDTQIQNSQLIKADRIKWCCLG